jgi:hypothetical protein
MDLEALRLVITDADLAALARRLVPADGPVGDLRPAVVAGAVRLSGNYRGLVIPLPFTTAWEPSVRNGFVCLRLAGVSVVGVPAGLLQGMFLDAFRDAARRVPGASVEGDALLLDLDRALAARGIPLRTNLKSVRCEPGRMTVEA